MKLFGFYITRADELSSARISSSHWKHSAVTLSKSIDTYAELMDEALDTITQQVDKIIEQEELIETIIDDYSGMFETLESENERLRVERDQAQSETRLYKAVLEANDRYEGRV
jgi:predicted  nucleic acid-binding Zn-ribbon protein